MNSTTESEKNAAATEVPQPKTKRTPAKKGKPAKNASPPRNRPPNPKWTAPTGRPK